MSRCATGETGVCLTGQQQSYGPFQDGVVTEIKKGGITFLFYPNLDKSTNNANMLSMADKSDLIDRLDPARNYGPRTYEQVKSEVSRGLLVLEPGHSVPVIRDAASHKSVKGTGRPPGSSDTKVSRAYIERRFGNNKKAIWDAIFKGAVEEGDPRWGKLLLEYGLGKPMENSSNFNEGVLVLLQKLTAGQASRVETVRETIIEQVPD